MGCSGATRAPHRPAASPFAPPHRRSREGQSRWVSVATPVGRRVRISSPPAKSRTNYPTGRNHRKPKARITEARLIGRKWSVRADDFRIRAPRRL